MITSYKDYMPKVYDAFPNIDHKDLDRIVVYGLNMYTLAHIMKCAVKSCNKNMKNIVSTQRISSDVLTQRWRNCTEKRRSDAFKKIIKSKRFF